MHAVNTALLLFHKSIIQVLSTFQGKAEFYNNTYEVLFEIWHTCDSLTQMSDLPVKLKITLHFTVNGLHWV